MLFYILETVEFTVASPDISSADIPPAIPAVGPYFPSPDTWVEDDLEMPPPLKVDDTYSLITLKARSPLYEVDISRFSFDHTYSKMSRKPKAISPDSDREVYPDEDKSGDLETVDLESAELLDLLYTLWRIRTTRNLLDLARFGALIYSLCKKGFASQTKTCIVGGTDMR